MAQVMFTPKEKGSVNIHGVDRQEVDKLIPGLDWQESVANPGGIDFAEVEIGEVNICFFANSQGR